MTVSPGVVAAPRHYALRMWAFFAGYFVFGGVSVPFFPVWLEGRGLTDSEIATVVALPLAVRVLLTPLAGMLADRMPNRRSAILLFVVPGALIFLLAWPASSFWPILLVTTASFTLWNLALPVGEALALTGVRRFGLDYGRMRLGGSVSFIVTNLSAGALLSLFVTEAIFWFVFAALVIAAVVSFMLPVTPPAIRAVDDATRPEHRSARGILGHPAFLALIAAGSLIQASHAVLYSFGSIHWRSLGFGSVEIGAFWAIGVVCEIAVFMWSGRLIRVFGAVGLVVLGGSAAIVRWSVMSTDPGLAITLGLQGLHALTFGAVYLGNQHAIVRTVPEKFAASAQGIFAMVQGLAMAGGLVIAGPLYHALDARAFLAMTVPAALGLLILGTHRLFAGRPLD